MPGFSTRVSGISTIDGKRLVFLVGAWRSGTTWTQLMLASRPEVVTAQETFLFSNYLTSLFRAWDLFEATSPKVRLAGLGLLFSQLEYFELIRQIPDGVFTKILAQKPEATVILEKTPKHVSNCREILNMYADAYFLHLVRDPRAVVSSTLAAHESWGAEVTSPLLIDACSTWLWSVREGREIAEATKNYREIRYEDLLADGVETLRSTFAWMGVELTPAECQEILDRHTIDKVRSGVVEGAPWNVAEEPQNFFRKGAADGWKSELSRHQIHFIEAMTRREMSIFGYQPVSRGGLTPAWATLQLEIFLKRVHSKLYWKARRFAEDNRLRRSKSDD